MSNEKISTILTKKSSIIAWLARHNINHYTLVKDEKYGWTVSAQQDVRISMDNIESNIDLVKFSFVEGDFTLEINALDSLEFLPSFVKKNVSLGSALKSLQTSSLVEVGGDFHCTGNELKNLKGGPTIVGGNYYCHSNLLAYLTGAPTTINGNFCCQHNPLLSLTGGPSIVKGNYSCKVTKIKSLTGAPNHIKGDFFANHCSLTSLKGSPQLIEGNFIVSYNKIASLSGSPRTISGGFNCSNNLLTNLKGAPLKIKTAFILMNNNLENIEELPQGIEGSIDLYDNPRLGEWQKFRSPSTIYNRMEINKQKKQLENCISSGPLPSKKVKI